MYDYCIVGGGIVGKYIAYLLRDKHSIWISGNNPKLTSHDSYQLSAYLGIDDTWQEKATGLISVPVERDFANFPFSAEQYQQYQEKLFTDLEIKSLEATAHSHDFQFFTHYIQSYFPNTNLHYFYSGHKHFLGPKCDTREEYEHYWQGNKLQWAFLAAKPDFLQVEFLDIANNQATTVVGRDLTGKLTTIKAKHFILACHTPGNLALIQQTYAKHRMYTERMRSIGSYFSDHLQLSFGFLVPDLVVPRTSLASLFFQDYDVEGMRFRLEFHTAPPRENLMKICLNRMPDYNQADFFHHFLRIVAIAEFPPMAESQLQMLSGGQYRVSKKFSETMHRLRAKLLQHLKQAMFKDLQWTLLNRHQPKYYGGHLIGGLTYPAVVDATLTMHDFTNVHIAGSTTWQSGGLFNPTFTSLVFAQHLVDALPHY